MRDHERPGAGLPWRTRPRRPPRPIEPVIREQSGRPERVRPGRVIAVVGELEED